jgi:hypothetical protein
VIAAVQYRYIIEQERRGYGKKDRRDNKHGVERQGIEVLIPRRVTKGASISKRKLRKPTYGLANINVVKVPRPLFDPLVNSRCYATVSFLVGLGGLDKQVFSLYDLHSPHPFSATGHLHRLFLLS